MTETYVAARDAQITVLGLRHKQAETLPWYAQPKKVEQSAADTGTKVVRQTGGLTADQFDHIFPLWAMSYPGRVQTVQ